MVKKVEIINKVREAQILTSSALLVCDKAKHLALKENSEKTVHPLTFTLILLCEALRNESLYRFFF